jgi:hypothetical protein
MPRRIEGKSAFAKLARSSQECEVGDDTLGSDLDRESALRARP